MVKNLYKRIFLFAGLFFIIMVNFVNSTKVNAKYNIWDGSIASNFAGGNGTEKDPFQIENGSQLALLSKYVNENISNYSTSYYILIADIFLNDTSNWENWKNSSPDNSWTSIGTVNAQFKGVFDGNGHKIIGMYGNEAKDNYAMRLGLFGCASEAIIKNVGVEKSCLIGKYWRNTIASIVCYLKDGIVDNCYNKGNVIGYGSELAGIVGSNYDGTVKNCYNYGKVTYSDVNSHPSDIGGIVALNYGQIDNCYNKGYVFENDKVKQPDRDLGGIVGNNLGKVENSYNDGSITCGNNVNCVGGIAGTNCDGNIVNSYNTGKITTGKNCSYISGIVGNLSGGTVQKSYNTGKIACSTNNKYIGGINGRMFKGKIIESYNKGNISISTNSESIGGVIGCEDDYDLACEILNCYNLGTITCGSKCKKVGGIAGSSDSKTDNCYNKGMISVGKYGDGIGGIIGVSLKGIITNCYNIGDIKSSYSTCLGGIVGNLGAYAIIDDPYPNIKSKVSNCYNLGNIGGRDCFYVGGIVGESYQKTYNSYNAGTVTAGGMVGGIIGRKTFGGNNIPSNCFYLKDCVKLAGKNIYKDEINTYGSKLTTKELKKSTFVSKLNKWVKEHGDKVYSSWNLGPSNKNKGYPYLKNNSN
ncbi:hypothetical protein EDD66_10491 [Mobilisporobacter senegalensis]|uniref:GLUG motif-containing protein n=1 Tax=Mobilisporobacter senegalensis TaxID=1329262 RepID=A0A3N1XPA4_9FIRM|nr:hypothetical protein [Mobilisporobacter senegalensis]ROR28509.1 hypothetical protein EDD66_10491 [Mobilisporobacter senegalensis]